ncbi:MAG: ABC transporter permease [Myxococcales bacterium]|nr:ABC transporter permease [Myxococcales bacterium]MDH5306284.1 ABC transporter permease [Myxococcales bacterium]MDH5565041.1 ABC transporter permease [Myxococcales bacterium]
MASAGDLAQQPTERIVIAPPRGFALPDLRELWRYRELVGLLALRDFKIRYKQSLLGAAWAVLQPLLTMVVFSVLFGLLLGRNRMPTAGDTPYAVSTYCALVPWQLFATALANSGNSLVNNQSLITKVYFPRLAAPLAPILAALVDFALAFAVLLALMAAYGIAPGWGFVALPGFVLLAILAALAASLWLSALNVLYRDVRHAIPFLVQLWMFVTPVVYASENLLTGAPRWAVVAYGLNPLAGVMEGFRWALLGTPPPSPVLLLVSFAMTIVLLLTGAAFFQRMERSFADLV